MNENLYSTGKGVIFDMDGVLVNSAGPHLESWRILAREKGRDISDGQFAATFGRQNRDIIPILFGEVSDKRLGELSDRKERLYREIIRNSVPVVSGAVQLVQDLHRGGASLAIGSSGPRKNIELVLTAMAVRHLFDVIVSADDVTRGKPDPQVFTVTSKRMGIAPSRCVVIEDAPVGVEAAKAAGMCVIAVMMHHPASAFCDPELVVDRLDSLNAARVLQLLDLGIRG